MSVSISRATLKSPPDPELLNVRMWACDFAFFSCIMSVHPRPRLLLHEGETLASA